MIMIDQITLEAVVNLCQLPVVTLPSEPYAPNRTDLFPWSEPQPFLLRNNDHLYLGDYTEHLTV